MMVFQVGNQFGKRKTKPKAKLSYTGQWSKLTEFKDTMKKGKLWHLQSVLGPMFVTVLIVFLVVSGYTATNPITSKTNSLTSSRAAINSLGTVTLSNQSNGEATPINWSEADPTTTAADPNVTNAGQPYPSAAVLKIFSQVLDRTKILIHAGNNIIVRDLREQAYSEGLQFGPQSSLLPWVGAFIRCDDADKPELVDLKADIIFAMYYSPHNSDDANNHWGDVPVVVVDGAMFGAHEKDLTVDGRIVFTYEPGSGSFWLHYNLQTGEAEVLY